MELALVVELVEVIEVDVEFETMLLDVLELMLIIEAEVIGADAVAVEFIACRG